MIGFVGFGHVGKALAEHLGGVGFDALSFYDPYVVLGGDGAWANTHMMRCGTLADLVEISDTVFLTVPDDAVGDVAKTIATTCGMVRDKLFIHTAGALNTAVLEPLSRSGAAVGSIHPLLAFNSHVVSVEALKKAYLVVEGDGESSGLMAIVGQMGNPILTVPSDKKPLYHGGACVVSNYITVVLDYGLEMIRSATGSTRQEVFDAAWPLIESALDNIRILGAHQALTGPLKRQDIQTVKAHMDQLGKGDDRVFYGQLVEATYRYMQKYDYPHATLDEEWRRKDDGYGLYR